MKVIKAISRRVISVAYLSVNKFILMKNISFKKEELISISTRFNLDRKASIVLGNKNGTRRNVEFSVSNEGEIIIGDNCFFNNNCMIVSHKRITIGNGCSFGPNVMVYDHDHDFRAENGLKSNKFKTTEISIGNNVWIGANSVILRGTVIEDNCVIAAGSIVKGHIKSGHILITEKNQKLIKI